MHRPGLVATNQHVVNVPEAKYFVQHDGKACPAQLAASDSESDLAILRIDPACLVLLELGPPLPVGSTAQVQMGDPVLVLGYPLADREFTRDPVASAGILKSTAGPRGEPTWMTLGADALPGNSGGPVVNAKGLVIGVLVAIPDAAYFIATYGAIPTGVSFAIKAEHLTDLAGKLGPTAGTAPVAGADTASRFASLRARTVRVLVMVPSSDAPTSGRFAGRDEVDSLGGVPLGGRITESDGWRRNGDFLVREQSLAGHPGELQVRLCGQTTVLIQWMTTVLGVEQKVLPQLQGREGVYSYDAAAAQASGVRDDLVNGMLSKGWSVTSDAVRPVGTENDSLRVTNLRSPGGFERVLGLHTEFVRPTGVFPWGVQRYEIGLTLGFAGQTPCADGL